MYFPGLSPYIFSIGSLHVHWYSVFMVISIVLGYLFVLRQKDRLGVSEALLSDALLWAVLGGVIGARLVFVAANVPGWFINDPMQILRVWQGGLSWHGAVGGGILASWLYLRKKPLPFAKFLDTLVVGISIGIILVRVGNIFNHEVLGHPTAYFPGGRWPAQPIGSAIGIFLLWRYFWYQKKNPPAGAQFWSFIFYYSLLRGFIEETVRDSPTLFIHYENATLGIGFVTVLQVFTPFLLALSWYMWRQALRKGAPATREDHQVTA